MAKRAEIMYSFSVPPTLPGEEQLLLIIQPQREVRADYGDALLFRQATQLHRVHVRIDRALHTLAQRYRRSCSGRGSLHMKIWRPQLELPSFVGPTCRPPPAAADEYRSVHCVSVHRVRGTVPKHANTEQ